MHYENPFIESIDHWVTVWLGSLNEDELENYLDEPGGAGDNEPISAFGRDLGQWYDHDFIYAEGVDSAVSVPELCRINDIDSQRLIDEVSRRHVGGCVNSLLILWNAQVLNDGSARAFAGGRLTCLGSWEHPSPLTD